MKKLLYPALAAALYVSFSSSPLRGQEGANLIHERGIAMAVTTDSMRAPVASQMPSARAPNNRLTENTALTSSDQSAAQAFPNLMPNSGPNDGSNPEGKPKSGSTSPLITVSSSLAVVLGLFAALIWATRKFGARGGGNKNIPKEVFQTLGSTSIDPRTQVSLLRCGQRILIIARTNNGVHPLGEITDKDEVSHLIATCTGDSKQEFRSALASLESEPTGSGYIGRQPERAAARSRSRLFASA
ncbi:MAG: FliO/MopB family protein [Rubripirellula sp.]|jgi:flagellar biogenesis protein FliO